MKWFKTKTKEEKDLDSEIKRIADIFHSECEKNCAKLFNIEYWIDIYSNPNKISMHFRKYFYYQDKKYQPIVYQNYEIYESDNKMIEWIESTIKDINNLDLKTAWEKIQSDILEDKINDACELLGLTRKEYSNLKKLTKN